MKRLLIIITVLGMSLCAQAQQELQVSQYMFNQLLTNPAYSGTHTYGSASILHRSQWVSLDESPVSQVACFETPIKDKLGLGFTLTNDGHGIIDELNLTGNFGYKFNLTSTTKLSLAIRAGISSYSANFSDILVWDNDPVYTNNLNNEIVPKFGAGAYLYDELWYVGLSVPTLTALSDEDLNIVTNAGNYFEQHYYMSGGYVFKLSPILDLRPSVLLKYENAAPLEADINVNFLLNKKLWLGAGYRTGDAFIGMIEYNFTNRLRAGYAYDFTTTEISNYSNGSHEIMIALDLGQDILIKKTSPRYF